jgi:hypothetical protein
VLVWQLPAPFAGEDLHRLAHRRLRALLQARLGDRAPDVGFAQGSVGQVVERCRAPASRPSVLVLPAFRSFAAASLQAVGQLAHATPEVPVVVSGWGAEPDYVDALGGGAAPCHPRLALDQGEPEEGLVDALAAMVTAPDYPREALAAAGLSLADGRGGWHARGRFREVADLGQLPSPYLDGDLRPADFDGMVLVEVARGCVFQCQFCLSCNFSRRGIRRFPAQRVQAEIGWAAAHGARAVGLLCSGLNYDLDMLAAVSEALAAIDPARRPRVESTIHTSMLDPRRLELMERLPWQRMIIGLQSTNPSSLALMRRRVDLDEFRAAIHAIAKFHTPVVEVILGLPGDTLRGFGATMRFVLDLPADIEVYRLRLDPGSAFMRDRAALGLEADFSREGRVVSTPTFSADDLERAAAALRALGSRPWPYRARRLGFDFKPVYESAKPR